MIIDKTPLLKKRSFMGIPTILEEYRDGLLAQKDDCLEQNIHIIGS